MEKDRSQMTDCILNITLEIIYLLTGEDYVPSKKFAEDGTSTSGRHRISEGSSRNQSPIIDFSPPFQTTEENDKKILQLTNKIIELMSSEVPIRCQDVAIYLSMEEWEYLEGHKNLYAEAVEEDHQPPCLLKDIKSESEDEFQPTFQSTKVKTVPEHNAQNLQSSLVLEASTSSQISAEDIKSESDDEFQPTFQSTEVINDVKIVPEPIAQTEYLTTIYNPNEMPGTSVSNDHSSHEDGYNEDGDDKDGHTIEVCINDEPSSPPEATQPPQRFYSCSECPMLFEVKADMMRHQRLHERKPLTCKLCGKIYVHKAHLLRHNCILNEKRPFICSLCGQKFMCKSHLVAHLRVHTGEKPLVCQDCGKHFSCNSALITHRRMHTGEKPYKCSDCGKEYAQKHSLAIHQKIHSETKPFSCPECDESFCRQTHLDSHRKTHQSMRRYSCPDCGDFFMLLSSLIIHQKIHSAEKQFNS